MVAKINGATILLTNLRKIWDTNFNSMAILGKKYPKTMPKIIQIKIHLVSEIFLKKDIIIDCALLLTVIKIIIMCKFRKFIPIFVLKYQNI
jgi:hypothetical protein